MSKQPTPLFSCLCVTENRPGFLPWLLWNFDKQTWPHRELVIVDSSPQPFVSDRPGVRILTAPTGTGVAAKRNMALQAAQGELLTWFDDDDWQHPHKLALLAEALGDERLVYAGTAHGWFVDLATGRCARHAGSGKQPIFNSAGFRRAAVLPLRFPEKQRKATDTRWLQAIQRQHSGRCALLDREDLFFWLCHEQNLSNPAGRRRFPQELSHLQTLVGEGWGDTSEQLAALAGRLTGATPATTNRQSPITITEQQPKEQIMPSDPTVSVMIKATVQDTPYLDTMVRHMIAQARYPFAERAVIVERRPVFQGKYRHRPQASDTALDRVLDQLLADEVIDAVREVDSRPQMVRSIMRRYFVRQADRVPTHALSGGPIYATLFGLESMATDYVLQMDADVFFYSSEQSWVEQALQNMRQDEQLWLMMTHPGPPAGPTGKSLTMSNAARAEWDASLGLWRFRHATTRYFLCNRQQLRGRLIPLLRGAGCLPLEQCLSATLQQHNAFRGNLGDLASWHLHAWYHGAPFPEWAGRLAQTVAAGRFPAIQAGDYDLRLDRARSRQAWQEILPGTESCQKPAAKTGPAPAKAGQANGATSSDDGYAPLAVVIPIRNRSGQRVRNALQSLNWQTAGRPAQIIVVSHGSRPAIEAELAALCREQEATLVTIGQPHQPWNKSLALNTGIRAARPDIPFLMTMDTDMILAPNFLATVLGHLRRQREALVLCRISDLPQSVTLPLGRDEMLAAFDDLQAQTQLRARSGSGGIQAAPRDFFFDIRGYDEDLLWWGAMDGDMLNRAQVKGLRLVWIEEETAMLHQWHPRKHRVLTRPDEVRQARWHWQRNHQLVRQRANIATRNPEGWGGRAEG